MKKTDTIKLLAIINTAFPNMQITESMVELWHELLGDLEFNLAIAAVKKLILESPFPPTIADIRKRAVEIMTPAEDKIDASTAWGEVVHAIRMFGYPRPQEALESMSPRTRKVVEQMGWQEICQATEPGVVRGQFLRMYEAYSAREKQDALLPQKMRDEIKQIANLRLVEGGRS